MILRPADTKALTPFCLNILKSSHKKTVSVFQNGFNLFFDRLLVQCKVDW